MLNDLLIHGSTAKQLKNYLARPAHGLLISGATGSGKIAIARALAIELLGLKPEELDNYAYFVVIKRADGKQEITIDAVRDLTKTLSLKIPGNAPTKRVIIIEDAHFMNQEAQNALLKSLEEPAPATVFILTTIDRANLLPTITSRTTHIPINSIGQQAAMEFFADQPATDVKSAWALSQGLPGLLISLINDKNTDLRQGVNAAKTFLSLSRYERLLELDRLTKNKAELISLLEGLRRVLSALYRSSASKNDTQRLDRFIKATKLVAESQKDLESSVSPRLIILKLALNLPV